MTAHHLRIGDPMFKLVTNTHATLLTMIDGIMHTAKDRMSDWDANFYMRDEATEVVELNWMLRTTTFDMKDGTFAIVRSRYTLDGRDFIEGSVHTHTPASMDALTSILLQYCRMYGREAPRVVFDESWNRAKINVGAPGETRYYVSTNAYIGSFPDEHLDDDTVVISTEPCRTNQDREPRIEGWCGSTGDISVTAFGEYETLEAAQAYAETKLLGGQFRVVDLDNGDVIDPNVVAAYRYGSEPAWNGQASVDFMNGFHDVDLEPDTTDEEIETLVTEWIEDAKTHGGIRLNHKAIVKAAIQHRDDLKAKAAEEEAEAA